MGVWSLNRDEGTVVVDEKLVEKEILRGFGCELESVDRSGEACGRMVVGSLDGDGNMKSQNATSKKHMIF